MKDTRFEIRSKIRARHKFGSSYLKWRVEGMCLWGKNMYWVGSGNATEGNKTLFSSKTNICNFWTLNSSLMVVQVFLLKVIYFPICSLVSLSLGDWLSIKWKPPACRDKIPLSPIFASTDSALLAISISFIFGNPFWKYLVEKKSRIRSKKMWY